MILLQWEIFSMLQLWLNVSLFLWLQNTQNQPIPIYKKCLEPQVKAITAVTEFRESYRRSKFFNHLSSVSEAIPGIFIGSKPSIEIKFSIIMDFHQSNTGSTCQRNERRRHVLY